MDTAPHPRFVRVAQAQGKHSPGCPVAGFSDVGSTPDPARVSPQFSTQPAGSPEQDLAVQERLKLARDLHDGFLQDITATLMQMRAELALQKKGQKDGREQAQAHTHTHAHTMPGGHLERAILMAEDTVARMRRRVGELRQPLAVPAKPEFRELCTALQEHLHRTLQYSGTTLQFDACPELPMEQEPLHEVLQIAGEAVANALKHGAADHIACTVRSLHGVVTVTVSDNGGGFQIDLSKRRKQAAFGLTGMKERAALLCGDVEVINTVSRGVTVRLQFPHPLVAH